MPMEDQHFRMLRASTRSLVVEEQSGLPRVISQKSLSSLKLKQKKRGTNSSSSTGTSSTNSNSHSQPKPERFASKSSSFASTSKHSSTDSLIDAWDSVLSGIKKIINIKYERKWRKERGENQQAELYSVSAYRHSQRHRLPCNCTHCPCEHMWLEAQFSAYHCILVHRRKPVSKLDSEPSTSLPIVLFAEICGPRLGKHSWVDAPYLPSRGA